jgi:ribosomal protein S18 acetylase RimI-like enzyme
MQIYTLYSVLMFCQNSILLTSSQNHSLKNMVYTKTRNSFLLKLLYSIINQYNHMITIHKTTIDDIESIRELLHKSWIETYIPIGISREAIDTIFTVGSFYPKYVTFLSKDTSIAYIARDEIGTIIGLISAFSGEKGIKVFSLYVDSEFQGQGIGKRLMNIVIDLYKDTDIYVATLEKNISAQGFYIGLGFIPTGTVYPIEFDPGRISNDREYKLSR